MNVKRIAALATGAAMVGAAFAGAQTVDSSVGSYKFFDASGEPAVKIVVGSKAQVSDGVAAAQIAAMLGNLAYLDKDVVGTATGGTGGSASGSVTGKNAVLQLTSPAGATGQTGTTVISTQLYDYIDISQVVAGTGRTDDAATSLLGDGVTTGGYKISNTLFPSIAYRDAVTGLGTYSVTQEDAYYIAGRSYYDTTNKAYLADRVRVAYATNFTDAIPFHVDIVNGSTAGLSSTDEDKTDNRNVVIHFLGSSYVITDFENGTATANPSISLGQASVTSKLKGGEEVKVGDKSVKLVSISPIGTGLGTQPAAYFQVLSNGTVVDSFSIQKGDTDYNKNGVILHIKDVFVGTGDSSYADVSIYAAAITLTDNAKLVFQGDDATTKINDDAQWVAYLTFGQKVVGSDDQKTLHQIRLLGQTSGRIPVGTTYKVIEKPVFKQLQFLGLEIVDMDAIKLSQRPQTLSKVDSAPAGYNIDVNATELKSSYSAAFLVGGKNYDSVLVDKYNGRFLVKDSSSGNYTTPSDAGDDTLDYYFPATAAPSAVRLVSANVKPAVTGLAAGTIFTGEGGTGFWINSTGGADFLVTYNTTTGSESQAATVHVAGVATGARSTRLSWTAVPGTTPTAYRVYGFNATSGIVYRLGSTTNTYFDTNATPVATLTLATLPNATTQSVRLQIWEPVVDNTAALNGYWSVDLFFQDANYFYNSSATGTLTTTYGTTTSSGTAVTNFPQTTTMSVEQGYVTPGGSELRTLSLGEIDINYPKRLRHARYQFGAGEVQNVTSEGIVTTKTLAAGEEYALGGGYNVKVSDIGGTASCTGTAGTAGSATCEPAKASVVTPLSPSKSLVVLDTDASASAAQAIVVGGPFVNSVAAALGAAEITTPGSEPVVKVIGGKVLVAGYTAQDTTAAAGALVSWLSQNRDAVRGV